MFTGTFVSKYLAFFCHTVRRHILPISLIFFPSLCLLGQSWDSSPANNQYARFEAGAVKVNNKLYTFMGVGNGFIFSNHIEVYNFDTDSWADLGPMPTGISHQGIALVGTKIWMAGGRNMGLIDQSNIRIFDTQSHTWSNGPSLPATRAGGTLQYIDGKLHFMGGFHVTHGDSYFDCPNEAQFADHWIIDPHDWSAGWQAKASMPKGLTHMAATIVHNKIYVIGGQNKHDCDGQDFKVVYAYDPVLDTWTQKKNLPSPRSHNEFACTSYNGKIFLLGGQGAGDQFLIYDPITDTWSNGTPMPRDLMGAIATIHDKQLFLMMGGSSAPAPTYISAQKTSYKFSLIQSSGNNAPIVQDIPNQFYSAGAYMNLSIEAEDPDGGNILSYSASGLPLGITIDAQTGQIEGPIAVGEGIYPVTLTVSDQLGAKSYQVFHIVVDGLVSLPLNFLSVKGKRIGAEGVIQWFTENEQNFSHFVVERRSDGLSFEPRGRVQGGIFAYEFSESIPAFEDLYYRIKAVDLDGSYMYSPIIRIRQEIPNELTLYPNPGQGIIHGEMHTKSGSATLMIKNTLGQTVVDQSIHFKEGRNTFILSIEGHPPGFYFLLLRQGEKTHRKVLIKE